LILLFISSCDVEDEDDEDVFVNPCGSNKCVVFLDINSTQYNCFYENDFYCLYANISSNPNVNYLEECSHKCKGGKWELNEICQEYISYCNNKTGKCTDYYF